MKKDRAPERGKKGSSERSARCRPGRWQGNRPAKPTIAQRYRNNCPQKTKKSDALIAHAHYHCAIQITSHITSLILPAIDRWKLHDVGGVGGGE